MADGNGLQTDPRPAIADVGEREFEAQVVERSRELPVVVDFWAEWCGPCKQLTPVLERAVAARPGKVELAKVDVDANKGLATAFRVQGIPSVKAFRDGRVAAEFTGALPPAEVERFFDSLVPSEADDLATAGSEDALRRALELDPTQALARRKLGRILLERGEEGEALELLEGAAGDFVAEGLVARTRLGNAGLEPAFQAWDEGDFERALALLLDALPDPERQDLIRRVMVGIFTELGADDQLARDYRRRLSSALN